MFENIESLCCTPESNIIWYVNYISIKKKIIESHWVKALPPNGISLQIVFGWMSRSTQTSGFTGWAVEGIAGSRGCGSPKWKRSWEHNSRHPWGTEGERDRSREKNQGGQDGESEWATPSQSWGRGSYVNKREGGRKSRPSDLAVALGRRKQPTWTLPLAVTGPWLECFTQRWRLLTHALARGRHKAHPQLRPQLCPLCGSRTTARAAGAVASLSPSKLVLRTAGENFPKSSRKPRSQLLGQNGVPCPFPELVRYPDQSHVSPELGSASSLDVANARGKTLSSL